ncbi:TPA: hypothetical protein HA244_03815 [Candidatus Micrarchaeota archaeon]|nr:hypothetical protein [Candidatus Micrarchaeota archaeon]
MAHDRGTFVINRYKAFLDKKTAKKEGFLGKFAERTGLRVRELAKKPVESLIYYTLASLPVPMWSEDDAAGVTKVIAERWGSTFEPPRLPSERETQMLKTIAGQHFREFLHGDPVARNAFLQHYRAKHGSIPVQIHDFARKPEAPRISVRPTSFSPAQAAHTGAGLRRIGSGKPLSPVRRPLQNRKIA